MHKENRGINIGSKIKMHVWKDKKKVIEGLISDWQSEISHVELI